jgi:hypothetical protein
VIVVRVELDRNAIVDPQGRITRDLRRTDEVGAVVEAGEREIQSAVVVQDGDLGLGAGRLAPVGDPEPIGDRPSLPLLVGHDPVDHGGFPGAMRRDGARMPWRRLRRVRLRPCWHDATQAQP